MDFVTGLSIITNYKKNSYDSIFVIADWLIKIVNYKQVKITINALGLRKVIIIVVVWQYGLLNSIMINRSSLFILKFWLLLCYFFSIKQRLFTIFYP